MTENADLLTLSRLSVPHEVSPRRPSVSIHNADGEWAKLAASPKSSLDVASRDNSVVDPGEEDPGRLCTSRRAPLVVMLAMSVFLCFLMVSMIAPFMPEHLRSLGGGSTANALMFSLYPAVYIPSALLVGRIIQHRGPLPTLFTGILVLGGAAIGFGMLESSIILLFVMRGLQGIGSAALSTSVFSISVSWFSADLQKFVVGLNEGMCGLGFMSGPVLGSALFTLGGFRLPFLVLGATVLAMFPTMLLFIRCFGISEGTHRHQHARDFTEPLLADSVDAVEIPHARLCEVLTAHTVLIAIVGGLMNMGFGCYNASLAMHLKDEFGIGENRVGYIFFICSFFYGTCSPLAGLATTRISPRTCMTFGCLCFGFGFVMMGPLPPFRDVITHYIHADTTTIGWVVQSISQTFIGIGGACMMVPALPLINALLPSDVRKRRPESLVASFFNSVMSLGEAIGPLLGSGLQRPLSFGWAMGAVGFGIMAYAPVVLCCVPKRPKEDRREGRADGTDAR
eukprot:806753_1